MCCKLKCASERACGDVLYPSSSIVCIMLFAGAFFAQVIQQKRSSTTVLLADAQKDLLLPFMELKTAVRFFFSISLERRGSFVFCIDPRFLPLVKILHCCHYFIADIASYLPIFVSADLNVGQTPFVQKQEARATLLSGGKEECSCVMKSA